MPRHTNTWKDFERQIAKLFHGKRTGPTGVAAPDVVAGHLAIECKHRRSIARYLLDAVAQAKSVAKPTQLPIVIVHGKRMKYTDSLVIISADDFLAWFVGDTSDQEGQAELQEDEPLC